MSRETLRTVHHFEHKVFLWKTCILTFKLHTTCLHQEAKT